MEPGRQVGLPVGGHAGVPCGNSNPDEGETAGDEVGARGDEAAAVFADLPDGEECDSRC